MNKQLEASRFGRFSLLLTTVATGGIIWIGYFLFYGLFEVAYNDFRRNNDKKYRMQLSYLSVWSLSALFAIPCIFVIYYINRGAFPYMEQLQGILDIPKIEPFFVFFFLVSLIFSFFSFIEFSLAIYTRFKRRPSSYAFLFGLIGIVGTAGTSLILFLLQVGFFEMYHKYYDRLVHQNEKAENSFLGYMFFCVSVSLILIQYSVWAIVELAYLALSYGFFERLRLSIEQKQEEAIRTQQRKLKEAA